VPEIAQGTIVVARVCDPQGKNPKLRPLVLVDATAEMEQAESLAAVAITSRFQLSIAHDEVLLPWHAQGIARTGLTKPSVAKCGWQLRISKSDIVERKGFVPVPHLRRVLEIISRLG